MNNCLGKHIDVARIQIVTFDVSQLNARCKSSLLLLLGPLLLYISSTWLVTSDPLQGRGKLTLGTVATGAGMSAAAPDCGLN